jgi:hypothetical protein
MKQKLCVERGEEEGEKNFKLLMDFTKKLAGQIFGVCREVKIKDFSKQPF